ncbi:hypothetical protein D3C87_1919190 [compost metagenome]
MYYFTFPLQFAFYHQKARTDDLFAVLVEQLFEHNQVGSTCFIFDGDKTDAAGGSRPLPDQYKPGHTDEDAVL